MSNNILPGPLGAEEIRKFLPHRYPFLLIDRVLSMETEPEKRLVGLKNLTLNEEFFQGHFPGHPVMPGVLIIEAMAQAAGVLANLDADLHGRTGSLYYLAKVNNARFSRPVVPGDQLVLEAVQKRIVRGMGLYHCQATVEGERAAKCELLCAGK